MIISHKYKFIFLNCRKVAGSSITAYLNRFLGPEDLQIGSWRDSLRYGGNYNKKFVNDIVSLKGLKTLVNQSFSNISNFRKSIFLIPYIIINLLDSVNGNLKAFKKFLGFDSGLHFFLGNLHKELYNYENRNGRFFAKELKILWPKEMDSYFKFCFVRNPYDKVVSDYRWRCRTKKISNVSFLEFLKRLADPSRPDPEKIVPKPKRNWPIYTINDAPIADFIGRFEDLVKDFAHICKTIGIPFDAERMPRAKASKKGKNFSYKDWYGEREVELVEKIFQKEIDYFSYSL